MTAESRYNSNMRSKRRSRASTTASTMDDVLGDIIGAVSNLEGAWPQVGEIWHKRQTKIFETGSNGRWAPLRVSTILRKRHDSISPDTLVETGTLRAEVSSPAPRSSGAHFVVLGPSRGAAIDYAKFHLRGSGVPQRNPVPRLGGPERVNLIDAIRDFYRPPDGKSKAREVRLRMGIGI